MSERATKVDDGQVQARPSHRSGGRFGFADLIAEAEIMAPVVALGRRAAGADTPVLIEGEPGAGKARLALAIHDEAGPRERPFVTVNCATGSDELSRVKASGTLFLDEVAALSGEAQAELLRVLRMDVRVIAATSANLIDLVTEGRFREDLYYRLNVFPIRVPPLRKRPQDIPAFVRCFAARFAAEEGKAVSGIDANAIAMLQRYAWPGNLRQLENAVFRAVVLADAPILTVNEFPQIAAHVDGFAAKVPEAPAPMKPSPRFDGPVMLGQPAEIPATVPMPASDGRNAIGIRALSDSGEIRSLEAVEADMIRLALGRYRGRMTEIARRLGIGRSTLYRKMREIGIEARAG